MPYLLRQLSVRFFVAVGCFGLGLAIWPLVANLYAAGFCKAGSGVLLSTGGAWRVVVQPIERPTNMFDVEVVMRNKGLEGAVPYSTKYSGYTPTWIFLSLLAATPLTWRQRVIGCVAGLALVHLWIVVGLVVLVVHGYSGDNPVALYSFGPTVTRALSFLMNVINVSTVTRYAVGAFVWMIVVGPALSRERFLVGRPADDSARQRSEA